MLDLGEVRAGDVLVVDEGGAHFAVVLKVFEGYVYAVCGTTKRKADWGPEVTIERGSRHALRMGFTETTYFYRRKAAIIYPSKVIHATGRRCSVERFDELASLVGQTRPQSVELERANLVAAEAPATAAGSKGEGGERAIDQTATSPAREPSEPPPAA